MTPRRVGVRRNADLVEVVQREVRNAAAQLLERDCLPCGIGPNSRKSTLRGPLVARPSDVRAR
jgi:hypothetical protein